MTIDGTHSAYLPASASVAAPGHSGTTPGEGVLGYVQEMLRTAPHARVRTQGPELTGLAAIMCSENKFFCFTWLQGASNFRLHIRKFVFPLFSKRNEGYRYSRQLCFREEILLLLSYMGY